MEQRIFDIIFKEDEVTWQALLMDLVRSEGMDPWNIEISQLTAKYIDMLKKMQEMDLRISGKVVLAAAILLKFKSNYLLGQDLLNFDKLLHPEEYDEGDLYEENGKPRPDYPSDARLIPKTPQPRKRKVSIYELVEALKQALEVKRRRREIIQAIQIPLPERRIDVTVLIEQLFKAITDVCSDDESVTFSELVPEGKKEEVIAMFLPLLHLSNQRRIDLDQQTHFGDIEISLASPNKERQVGSAMNEVAKLDKKHDFVGDALDESDKR